MSGEAEDGKRGPKKVRTMQLFHELKQQFPAAPDQVVSECIAASEAKLPCEPQSILKEAAALLRKSTSAHQHHQHPELPNASAISSAATSASALAAARRPQSLPLPKPYRMLQESKAPTIRYPLTVEKPPRSPNSPRKTEDFDGKKSTLLPEDSFGAVKNEESAGSVGVIDLKPILGKSQLLPPGQRSFTSVNLTLRTPSAEPQEPIDITSKNASLTYSTSCFDSQKGLRNHLEITVSPTGGTVSSYRMRPRSVLLEEDSQDFSVAASSAAASPQDFSISPILAKQKARIERLKIEVTNGRNKLVALQQEVDRLESGEAIDDPQLRDALDEEIEKQLLKEINHLRAQCDIYSKQVDQGSDNTASGEGRFYRNLCEGQRGPSSFGRLVTVAEEEPWTCPQCTFQNHPLIKKCEQCDMAHIVHVSAAPGDKIHIHVTPRRIVHSWVI